MLEKGSYYHVNSMINFWLVFCFLWTVKITAIPSVKRKTSALKCMQCRLRLISEESKTCIVLKLSVYFTTPVLEMQNHCVQSSVNSSVNAKLYLVRKLMDVTCRSVCPCLLIFLIIIWELFLAFHFR